MFGEMSSGYTEYVNALMDESAQEVYDNMYIYFTDESTTLEYGDGQWDTASIISEISADCELEISIENIDLNEVGTTEVTYTLTTTDDFDQTITKSYTKEIIVEDTSAPVITFSTTSDIKLTIGDSFDGSDYISSVTDSVDGELEYCSYFAVGCYTILSTVDTTTSGDYTLTVVAEDVNGNTTVEKVDVYVRTAGYNYNWDGTVLTATRGTIMGPSGKETYYNLDMSGIVSMMHSLGYNYEYWVRSDGVKMFGDYVMVAANLSVHPRGSLVETSLGTGIVCDTGGFAQNNIYQLDIATNW